VPSSKELGRTAGCCWAGQPLTAFEAARRKPAASRRRPLGSSQRNRSHLLVGSVPAAKARPICRGSAGTSRRAASSPAARASALTTQWARQPEQRRQLDSDLHACCRVRVAGFAPAATWAPPAMSVRKDFALLEVAWFKKRGGPKGDQRPELPRQDFSSPSFKADPPVSSPFKSRWIFSALGR